MGVAVRVRLPRRVVGTVIVLMMQIVAVSMSMREGFMKVFMLMPLSEMKPNAHEHEKSRYDQTECDRFAENQNCNKSAHEGSS
jgi:hypothetical protein